MDASILHLAAQWPRTATIEPNLVPFVRDAYDGTDSNLRALISRVVNRPELADRGDYAIICTLLRGLNGDAFDTLNLDHVDLVVMQSGSTCVVRIDRTSTRTPDSGRALLLDIGVAAKLLASTSPSPRVSTRTVCYGLALCGILCIAAGFIGVHHARRV